MTDLSLFAHMLAKVLWMTGIGPAVFLFAPFSGQKGGCMEENKFISGSGWPQVHGQISTVSFQIQSGPIKEFGVNGCQIDDVIAGRKKRSRASTKRFRVARTP